MKFKPNPAVRATVAEVLESSYIFEGKSADDKKPPKFALLPTGEKANTVFLVATLMSAKIEEKFATATIVDKTGKIRIRASKDYQALAYDQIERLSKSLPTHVAVVGRVNVYEPQEKKEDGPDRFISLQPEGIAVIEKPYRDDWNEEVYQETLRRAESWNNETLTEEQQMAREIYGDELRETVLQRIRTAYNPEQPAEGAA